MKPSSTIPTKCLGKISAGLKNAINIPFDTLSEDKLAKYRNKTIILI